MARYSVADWLFRRLLGLVYLCAFGSLALQIVGLAGSQGIVPAGVSDWVLRSVCLAGAAMAIGLVAGFAPAVTLPALWLSYLWLSSVASEFLLFQWDALLLEAGLLAVFVAPLRIRDRLTEASEPPPVGLWLMRWLLFRLMAGSGAVKLASGDPTWHNFTALTFHYETQPIPNRVAFYAHHLPAALNRASTAATLVIELMVPFLMFGPPRLRRVAAAALAALQGLIALTGNFAFFNLLAVALCVFLVDDAAWAVVARPFRLHVTPRPPGAVPTRRMPRAIVIAVAVVTAPVSLLAFTSSLGLSMPGSPLVEPVARLIAPLRSVNSYGLFAVMTTTRPEIIVEGSADGERWMEYEFKYKPGDVRRAPPFVAPHQPRLDWQMWFAALGRFEENVWFQNFCLRLLQAAPDVLRLVERDPFRGRPPKYVRAVLYQFRFADQTTHKAEGLWWTRQRLGAYSPVLSLSGGGVR